MQRVPSANHREKLRMDPSASEFARRSVDGLVAPRVGPAGKVALDLSAMTGAARQFVGEGRGAPSDRTRARPAVCRPAQAPDVRELFIGQGLCGQNVGVEQWTTCAHNAGTDIDGGFEGDGQASWRNRTSTWHSSRPCAAGEGHPPDAVSPGEAVEAAGVRPAGPHRQSPCDLCEGDLRGGQPDFGGSTRRFWLSRL